MKAEEKTQRIKTISEAFSMQPAVLTVGALKIAEINKEKVTEIVAGDPFDYDFYIGYDEAGNKLFQYRAIACNVHYFPESKNLEL